MLRKGSSASAAVMPTSFSPPNENMMTAIDMARPLTPNGKKPPNCQRFATLAWGPACPDTSSQPPNRIIPTIAATLTMANQNSVSPYDFTLVRLMALTITKHASAETQVGKPGHQYCM